MVNTINSIKDPIFSKNAILYAKLEGADYYLEKEFETIFQLEIPNVDKMKKYLEKAYEDGIYKDYSNARKLKIKTGQVRLKIIEDYNVPGKLNADIGCSTGSFMEAALDFGYKVTGYELSEKAISLSPDFIKPNIIQADVNEHLDGKLLKYDLVTAYDILEHMQNPKLFLFNLKQALSSGGVLAISTPDTSHFLRKIMRSSWPMLQPMQHTVLFSKTGLSVLLEDLGFCEVKVFPGQKVLTLRYLFNQVIDTTPHLKWLMKIGLTILPKFLLNKEIIFNISEMFVLCRNK